MGSDHITISLFHSLNLPHLTVHGAALYHTLERFYKMKVFNSEYNYKLSEVLIAIVALERRVAEKCIDRSLRRFLQQKENSFSI